MTPFDYLKAINNSKKNIIVDDLSENEYNAFMVNRGLSFFPDTVLMANEMNISHHLDSKLQFDFLINIIKKKSRFTKWSKKTNIENLEVIKQYYGYSNEKARSVLSLFSNDEIADLNQRISKGGRTK
jgi:hypothetical protein|tara:strand:- start:932 stop:1312 length:381 start_codon:yes stop_codon:yes gene_type:complete